MSESAETTDINIKHLLVNLIEVGGSDLHIVAGAPPVMRIHGLTEPMEGYPVLRPQ